jgi:hypothetical protein
MKVGGGWIMKEAPGCLQISSTANGRTVRITSIDVERGYIYGTIDGIEDLQTWGYPDGQILTHNDLALNLNMETV